MSKGILLRGRESTPLEQELSSSGLPLTRGPELLTPGWLLWEKTIVIKPGAKIRSELLETGLNLLDNWDLLVPLDKKYLALDEVPATNADRNRARKILRDLRVPAPYTGWLFFNRRGAARDVIDAWAESDIEQEQLAFMTAVYRVMPKIMLVPTEWLYPESEPIRKRTRRKKRARR